MEHMTKIMKVTNLVSSFGFIFVFLAKALQAKEMPFMRPINTRPTAANLSNSIIDYFSHNEKINRNVAIGCIAFVRYYFPGMARNNFDLSFSPKLKSTLLS
jgi:hypothetical protein